MKNFIGTVSAVIFALGIAIGILGAVLIGWGILFGPKGGPQSPKGSFPAYAFGATMLFIGLVGVAIGRSLDPTSKAASPKGAAEPGVGADGPAPRR